MSDTTNDTFRIDRLTLRNFRCFEEKTIDFHPRFNVLIGDNGSGKTAVLDAIAVAASAVLYGLVGDWGRLMEEADVRLLPYQTEGLPRLDPQYPTQVHAAGVAFGEFPTEWVHSLERPESRQRGATGHSLTGPVLSIVAKHRGPEVWPLIGYYNASRFWSAQGRAEDLVGQQPRAYGYKDCLRAAADDALFVRWFKTLELDRLQQGRSLPALVAAKRSVPTFAEECEGIEYAVRDGEMRVSLRNGRSLPFSMLSGGQKAALAMIGDMVWRASWLNPEFGENIGEETPGVVLIDEIDLHLHPKWQRHVVDDLKRAFPKVQFIVTTHSPFIIQSLERGEVINLDPGRTATPPSKSIEDIAEDVQGVKLPQLSQRRLDMLQAAEEFFSVLQAAKEADPARRQELKAKLDRLALRFSDDVAYHAFLRMERLAAGLEDDDQ